MVQGSTIYIGNTSVVKSYLGSQQVDYYPQRFDSGQFAVRSDPYSASLYLAMPYQLATNLGMTNFYDDISATIKGTGTNYQLVPSGSGTLNSSGTPVSSGSYSFSNDGYSTSLYLAATLGSTAKNAGVITTGYTNFGTQPFVIETWIKVPDVSALYSSHVFGNPSGDQLLCDYSENANTPRFYINGNGGFVVSPTNPFKNGVWYHLAFVRNGGSNRIYLDGTQIYSFSYAGSVANTPDGFWSILGINDSSYAEVPTYYQDFRLYIGTDKGYNGTTITPPPSMIYKL
jgi:hypothetical protein